MGQVLKSVNSFWMVELQSYRICKLAYSFYGKCTKSILYILEVFRAGVPNSERNTLIRNAWNWDKYEYETSWNAPEVFQKIFERILFHYYGFLKMYLVSFMVF